MFAILVPATLLPLIITLFWAEHKAKRLGIVDAALANARKENLKTDSGAYRPMSCYYI